MWQSGLVPHGTRPTDELWDTLSPVVDDSDDNENEGATAAAAAAAAATAASADSCSGTGDAGNADEHSAADKEEVDVFPGGRLGFGSTPSPIAAGAAGSAPLTGPGGVIYERDDPSDPYVYRRLHHTSPFFAHLPTHSSRVH